MKALRILGTGLGAILLAALGWAAWAAITPLPEPAPEAREALFEIPAGTYARRRAGEALPVLPERIDLTLGVRDVLLLRNRDDVPQTFGPALLMPGQSLRLPFEVASTYSFACSAHASGALQVVVAPAPAPGWPRLRWRLESGLAGWQGAAA